jgi:hypothetical protein
MTIKQFQKLAAKFQYRQFWRFSHMQAPMTIKPFQKVAADCQFWCFHDLRVAECEEHSTGRVAQ